MQNRVERYAAGDLLNPTSTVSAKAQQVRRVDVHWHDYYELVYVSGGTASHVINGVEHRVSPGSVSLLTPADFHEIRTDSEEPLTCYNVVIDAQLWESRLADFLLPGSELPWMLSDQTALEPDFERLWHESRTDRPGAVVMMQAALDCIVVELGRQGPAGLTFGQFGARSPSPRTSSVPFCTSIGTSVLPSPWRMSPPKLTYPRTTSVSVFGITRAPLFRDICSNGVYGSPSPCLPRRVWVSPRSVSPRASTVLRTSVAPTGTCTGSHRQTRVAAPRGRASKGPGPRCSVELLLGGPSATTSLVRWLPLARVPILPLPPSLRGDLVELGVPAEIQGPRQWAMRQASEVM